MDTYMILDIITITILVLELIIGIKRGFIKSVIGVIRWFVSIAAASFLSSMIADLIYKTFVHDTIMNNISNVLSSSGTISKISSAGPMYNYIINNLYRLGYNDSSILSMFNNSNAAQTIDNAISPIVTTFIQIIIFVILLVIFIFLSHFILNAINIVTHLPVIHQLDKLFGGILGIVEGIMLVFVLVLVLGVILLCTSHNTDIFSSNTIDSTFIFKYFYYLNPIYLIMSAI